MKVGARTAVFGLVGRPVRHSRSPDIYNPLFAAYGIDAVYLCFDVGLDRSAHLADAIRTLGLSGVNLTIPHKTAIVSELTDAGKAVVEARAANVVVNEGGGRLVGHNTDGEGFCRAFEDRFGRTLAGRAVVVFGAGGAARAVAARLARRGAARVTLLNRTPEKAVDAATEIGAGHPLVRFEAGPLTKEAFAARAPTSSLVVNCTAGPAREVIDAFDIDALPVNAIWADINYWMDHPPALRACESRGLHVMRGLDMLVHQGALAFELFTGVRPDPALIRANLG